RRLDCGRGRTALGRNLSPGRTVLGAQSANQETSMQTRNDHDIKVLNGLIETTLDSIDGYREAAKETQNPTFRAMFEQRSFERQRVATELQGTVRQLGGEPEDDGSMLAKAHRAFLDIKHALSKDDQAVVNSVENGE